MGYDLLDRLSNPIRDKLKVRLAEQVFEKQLIANDLLPKNIDRINPGLTDMSP